MKLPTYQELSKEQDEVNNLPLKGSHLVIGPPGTGKTVMAIYRTKMLTDNKVDVLLLMYNRLLAQYTRRATKELKVDGRTDTFHAWFNRYYKSLVGRYPPQIEPYVFDWEAILTRLNNSRSLFKPTKPAIVLDEAQDFPKEFFPVVRALGEDVIVFADENQRLTEQNSTIKDIRTFGALPKPIKLTRNYRNSAQIAALAGHFYTGLESGLPLPPTRVGPLPVMTSHGYLVEAIDFIVRYERNNSDLDIGIFVQTQALQKKFFNRLNGKTKNPVQIYEGGLGSNAPVVDFDMPGIKVVCYPSAKGLEFDTVFIPELQSVTLEPGRPEFSMTFYVLISRARNELYVMYTGQDEPSIVSAFPGCAYGAAVMSTLYFVTNRFNLLEIISANSILPKVGHDKYYADLGELSQDRVVLADSIPSNFFEIVSAESPAAFPAIIALDSALLDVKRLPKLTLNSTNEARVNLYSLQGSIPLTVARSIGFLQAEHIEEHRSRIYANVIHDLPEVVIAADVLQSSVSVDEIRKWLSNLPQGPTASDFQQVDRILGGIVATLHMVQAADQSLAERLVGLMNGGTREKKSAEIGPELFALSFDSLTKKVNDGKGSISLDERILRASTTFFRESTNPGFAPLSALDGISNEIVTRKLSKADAGEIQKNLDPIRAILRNEREFRRFKSGGSTAAKALLLVLLRPDFDRLFKWLPETGADARVAAMAGMMLGSIVGYKNLPATLKSGGVRRFAALKEHQLLSSKVEDAVRLTGKSSGAESAAADNCYRLIYSGGEVIEIPSSNEDSRRSQVLAGLSSPEAEKIALDLCRAEGWQDLIRTVVRTTGPYTAEAKEGAVELRFGGAAEISISADVAGARSRIEQLPLDWMPKGQ